MQRDGATMRTLILLAFTIWNTTELDVKQAFAEEPDYASLAQRDAIKHELSKLRNPRWAGSYETNFGWGSSSLLLIGETTGAYQLFTCGCTGSTRQKCGTVSHTENTIRIDWANDDTRLFDSENLVPAKCGENDYLVPRGLLLQFCVAMREQKELPQVWCRRSTSKRPVLQTPMLPERYKMYVNMDHIEGMITQILGIHRTSHGFARRASLDIGSNDGVMPDMQLYPRKDTSLSACLITILEVYDDRSTAIVYSPNAVDFIKLERLPVTTDPLARDEP
jgi:hypothetical protein